MSKREIFRGKKKPKSRMIQTLEANVKVTIKKTGKTYHRSKLYARHIISGAIFEAKEHTYFLRDNHKWREVTEREFHEATTKENVEKLHEALERDLKKRVEKEMGGDR